MVTGGFIERHGLWTDDQRRRAKALAARVKKEKLKLFRVAWADPHGAARAKTVTLPAFLDALKNGYNINVATTTLDASGARTFASFTRGGGMDLDEMIEKAKGRVTVPQIFIGDLHVGGSDELRALDREGKLDQLLRNDVS